jgi:hypothetical protein
MNPLIQLKTTSPLLITLALLCFELLPRAQAVVPAPDGGYPNFNTAEGQNALFSLTTGVANTAVGWFSLENNTDGSFNTGVGAGTLLFNIGDQTTGEGAANTAIGAAALLFNTTGFNNTAVGATALLNNTEGFSNTASGHGALRNNTTGEVNTANGQAALFSNTTGSGNTAIGFIALSNNTTGDRNIALGVNAGFSLTTSSDNIDIGNTGVVGESGTIRIGSEFQSRTFIAAIRGVTTGIADTIPVLIDSNGQLGTLSSSRRFKHEIKEMDNASKAIHALKPVTFHYKSDKTDTPKFGLIAEEVAKVNPDLVVRDKEGKPYSVRYDQVNAMLLNEFLKEHRKVEKLEATVADLAATVKEQAAHLQRVSAQLDNSVARMAVTNR